MTVTLELPDQKPLDAATLKRLVDEAYVLADYNAGKISFGDVGIALDLGAYDTEEFLQRHKAPITRDPDDLGL